MGHFCRKYGLLFLSLFFFLKVEGHEPYLKEKGRITTVLIPGLGIFIIVMDYTI